MSFLSTHAFPQFRRALRLPAVIGLLVAGVIVVAPLSASKHTLPRNVPAGSVYSKRGSVWVHDQDGKRQVFGADGTRLAAGDFRNGRREGRWTFYHTNGQKRGQGEFKAGRMQGRWELFHSNGRLASFGLYSDNYRIGLWTFHTPDGRKRAEGMYKDGYRWGEWKEYYSSGKVFYTGRYVRNREHGEFKYYTEVGRLVQAGQFRRGVRVGTWYICAGGRCGQKTFKRSETPRFSGGVSGAGTKSSGPRELLDILDGKKSRRPRGY